MARLPDAENSADTDEGGPVKSFLEHLEDLRWALIKCASAIAVGVIICLIAGNHVVAILMRPLQQATIRYPGCINQVVTVRLGTNLLGTYNLDPVNEELFNLDTNRSSPVFSPADIVRLKSFALKLKQPADSDGVSKYLATELSSNTMTLLAGAYDLGPARSSNEHSMNFAPEAILRCNRRWRMISRALSRAVPFTTPVALRA